MKYFRSKSKAFVTFFVGLVFLFALIGCDDGLTVREKECLQLTGNIKCQSDVDQKVRLMRAEADILDERADLLDAQGQPRNFYGDPRYGQWNGNQFQFYDPQSPQALSTGEALVALGIAGGIAGYAASKYAKKPSYYRTKYADEYKNVKYVNYKGQRISETEMKRREAQSARDRLNNVNRKNQKLQQEKAKLEADKRKLEMQKRKMQSERDKAKNQLSKNNQNKTLTKAPAKVNNTNLSKQRKVQPTKRVTINKRTQNNYRKTSPSRKKSSSNRRKKR